MRRSVALRMQMRQTIEDDIAQRTAEHQATVRRLRTARRAFVATGAPTPRPPILALAHGDSWFDYPLSGNELSIRSTDVIAHLQHLGDAPPVILNVSHHGDATSTEMSLPKQERMIQALAEPANWLEKGKPDAILFSGGGNDIAGNQFCIFLDHASAGGGGLSPERLQGALDGVESSYLALFDFRDRHAAGVPIFAHGYDFPIPNGVHPACAGPWLKPSLDFCGFDVAQGTVIVHDALARFRALLKRLADQPANNFVLVETQGTLAASDWANELHPLPDGFDRIAALFLAALQARL